MSIKRAATTDLNHDNWDKDDPADHEKMGIFKQAPQEVLEKRVIRTAKRRSTQPLNAEHQKSVFSGFSGFNKPQPASFDFLANLTNGQNNGKSDSAVSSSFVTSTPLHNNIFMPSVTSSDNKFNTNNATAKTTSNVFDVSSSTTLNPGSIFTTSIADSTMSNSVFKLPTKSIPNDYKAPFITNNSKPSQNPPPITPLFSFSTTSVAPIAKENISKEPVTSTSKPQNELFKQSQGGNKNDSAKNNDNEEENMLKFFGNIKKLNESFVEWITTNIKTTPVCNLSPTFDDYVKYMTELKATYLKNGIDINDPKSVNKALEKSSKGDNIFTSVGAVKSNTQQHSIFGVKSTTQSDTVTKQNSINKESSQKFNFGLTTSISTAPSATFSFSSKNTNEGKNTSNTNSGSIFSFKEKTETPTAPSSTFNSGSPQQFSFGNKPSVTTNTTFSSDKVVTTVGNSPGTEKNTTTPNYSFGIKNNAPPSSTPSPMFSFTNKKITPTSSVNTSLNTMKSPTTTTFTFGVKSNSTSTTAPPTFTFVNKASTVANKKETSTPSLFNNANIVTSTPFGTDKVSFETKSSVTTVSTATIATPLFSFSNNPAEISTDKNTTPSANFTFGIKSTPKTTADNNSISAKSPNFSFGTNNSQTPTVVTENKSAKSEEISSLPKNTSFSFTSSNNTFSTPNKIGFGTSSSHTSPFGASPDLAAPTFSFTKNSSPISTTSTTSLFGNSSAQFSFGTAKPFSFSPNVENKQNNENVKGEENEEPPKVEYTPVVEEDCVFEKKCKIFTIKDKNYVDMGVGTLYIKNVAETEKHQLLVRANTNIGTVLINLILSKDIPLQRMGKNNVMLVCIPTPESKPPPTPMLIRVKSTEEADGLLEQLKKFQT